VPIMTRITPVACPASFIEVPRFESEMKQVPLGLSELLRSAHSGAIEPWRSLRLRLTPSSLSPNNRLFGAAGYYVRIKGIAKGCAAGARSPFAKIAE
jgi:hypothetical protein